MQGEHWIVNSDAKLENYLNELRELYAKHKYLRCQVKTGKQRSEKQKRALEVYCRELAAALNDGGFDMRVVLKPDVEIPWSQQTVKDKLWRPIQIVMTKKKSTTKPDRDEYPQIYETLNRHIASKFGISVEWPSKDRKHD